MEDVEMRDAASDIDDEVRPEWVANSIFQHLLDTVCIDVASNLHQHIKTGIGSSIPVTSSSHVVIAEKSTDDSSTTDPTVQSRRQLYPELYEGKSEVEIQELLQKFAVDLPLVDGRKERSRKRLGTTAATGQWASDEDEEDEDDGDKIEKKGKKKKIGAGSDDEDDEDYQMEEEDKDDDEMEKGARKKRASSADVNNTTETTADGPTGTSGTDPAPATLGSVDIWGNRPSAEPTNVTCACRLCGRHVSTSRFASHLDKCMGLSTRPLAGSATRG